ncbi:hypothetical protein [Kitasatospora griseola]|uniref:hypothetical protein n=1 Tax=Kitasatospora griseola TaxID=2064 RepID=UPI001E5628EC|nr:hypothetical protein [Kitasatospora griseola]
MGRRAVPPGRIAALAALSELADPGADATGLGEFLAALHTPAPVEAPVNPYRGVPVDRGRIGAVIGFGDLTGGDPATDLSVAWTLFTADT